MKKFKMLVALTLISVFTFLNTVSAAELSDEEHARLSKIFSEPRIALMSQEEAEKYLSYDLDNAITATKYYKVNENINGSTYQEVTKEEAENAFNNITPYVATVTTTYKKMHISSTHISGNSYFVELTTEWLVTPSVKSYDVEAIRVENATISDGSQYGAQVYWTSSAGTYQRVNYSANGTNIVKKSNGFGISMNLVDDASYFGCDVSATVTANSSSAKVYGSYQHAVRGVTLSQSQNYTLSHNGLGNVINFASSVVNYYDGMAGVYIPLA